MLISNYDTSSYLPTSSTQSLSISEDNFSSLLEDEIEYKKPNTKQFMDLANIDFKTASELLYGVVGSNEDTRDWKHILTSDDPIQAIKEETNKMYNDNPPYDINAKYFKDTDKNIIAKTKNLTLTTYTLTSERKTTALYITDTNGKDLRMIHKDKDNIAKNMDSFGFDKEQLTELSKEVKDTHPTLSKTFEEAATYTPPATKPKPTLSYPTSLFLKYIKLV